MDRILVRARRSDPETSHQAAFNFEADQTKAQRSVRTVVQILTDRPPLSDFQIRELWDEHWDGKWSFTLPCKARHWARQQGLVMHAGFGKHQGRRVRTWTLGMDHKYLEQLGMDSKQRQQLAAYRALFDELSKYRELLPESVRERMDEINADRRH